MRRELLAMALAALVCAACATAPAISPVASFTAFREDGASAVYDQWPAVARRPWPSAGQNGMPAGFVDEVVHAGLAAPTALRFLPDGRLLVTEQAGLLKLLSGNAPDEPRLVLDLRAEVLFNYQLGLLGLAVDPDFENEPYVYLGYTRDAPPGGSTPTYGSPDGNDQCPSRFACPASARLVRYRLGDEGQPAAPAEAQVLLDDWCITGPNHTIGTIAFDGTGALLVGAGDGADGDQADYGQLASTANPCADAPDEGGSLRSQDLALGTDAVGLAGTIARVDRATGAALPQNPLGGAADANAARILAFGLRNPFRFTLRPGTDELWIGDVGWDAFEEIDVLPLSGRQPVNFGWPCFEGAVAQPEWQALATATCAAVDAAQWPPTRPRLALARGSAGDRACDSRSAATSAMAFYDATAFPDDFHGALFFADMPQRCLYVVQTGADGQLDPATARVFAHPVQASDLVVGPDGALYYSQVVSGEIHRISWQ